MQPNLFLKKLGFADDDRVVIFHADDLGMNQSGLSAFKDMIAVGPLSSGSVMVPCSWFPQMADYCRRHPEVDMGVHLTFTCEWDTYRWGPISTGDPASGLLDAEGYFYRTTADTQAYADVGAAQRELEAQIERALAAGIDVTHLDSHMGAVFHPKFLLAYVQAAQKYKLPLMMVRLDEELLRRRGIDAETTALVLQLIRQLEANDFPIIDHIGMMPLDQHKNRVEQLKQAIDALEPGLTHFVIHPSKRTPEIQAIAPDWRSRFADYKSFTHEEIREYVAQSSVHVMSYRTLRAEMRQTA